MNSQTLRVLMLLLFMPAALLPTKLDLCMMCILGDRDCESSCCQGADEAPEVHEAACCCSAKSESAEHPEVERRAPKAPCGSDSDCCIHIDNARDEVPAPAFALVLPDFPEVLIVAASGLEVISDVEPRPILAHDSSPPPEAPLPLLI